MKKRTLVPTTLVAALIFALSFVFGAQAVSGQDATPTFLDTEGGAQAHPAIHVGTCEDLGEVVFPLADVAPLDAEASPVASPAASPVAGGELDEDVVAESTTILEVPLEEIVAGEHAINVHESAENIENYIACGTITGMPENEHLRVDLQELNDSGLTGRAVLTSNADDMTTTVTVTLIQADTEMTGTPEATPAT